MHHSWHSHSHSHDLHDSLHSDPAEVEAVKPTPSLRLGWALALISSFALIECLVGVVSHSLVLVADSGHMLSDGLALAIAWLARWLNTSPTLRGWQGRSLETWAALGNGLILLAVALWLGWEAVERLQHPLEDVLSLPLLITALVSLLVSGINAALLHPESHDDLNLRGAFLHMLADAISSIGVLLAAIAIWALGWFWADGAISLVVAGFILLGTLPLLWESCQRLRGSQSAQYNP